MNKLRNIIFGFVAIFFIASPVMAVSAPVVSSVGAACESRFLGLPAWYRGLTDAGNDCSMKSPSDFGGIGPYITILALNIIEAVLFLIGYIAVFFVIYGGFQFVTGGSSPDKVARGRKTIMNALIGLVIAMSSIAIVNLVFGIIN